MDKNTQDCVDSVVISNRDTAIKLGITEDSYNLLESLGLFSKFDYIDEIVIEEVINNYLPLTGFWHSRTEMLLECLGNIERTYKIKLTRQFCQILDCTKLSGYMCLECGKKACIKHARNNFCHYCWLERYG